MFFSSLYLVSHVSHSFTQDHQIRSFPLYFNMCCYYHTAIPFSSRFFFLKHFNYLFVIQIQIISASFSLLTYSQHPYIEPFLHGCKTCPSFTAIYMYSYYMEVRHSLLYFLGEIRIGSLTMILKKNINCRINEWCHIYLQYHKWANFLKFETLHQ